MALTDLAYHKGITHGNEYLVHS